LGLELVLISRCSNVHVMECLSGSDELTILANFPCSNNEA
jgi:hypothetical protein